MSELLFALAALIVAVSVACWLLKISPHDAMQTAYRDGKKFLVWGYAELKQVVASVQHHGWKHYMPVALVLFVGIVIWRYAHGLPTGDAPSLVSVIGPLAAGSTAIAFSNTTPASGTLATPGLVNPAALA